MQKNSSKYPVEFVDGLFGESDALAKAIKTVAGDENSRVMIVADYNVVTRAIGLGTAIGRYMKANDIALAGTSLVMGGSEKIKNDDFQSVQRVISAFVNSGVKRGDVVVVIGGGTLMDVTGYVAAQFDGGLKVVRVPTTPSAMMDAAFADHAAVNYSGLKDILTVPALPAAVLIDTRFAESVMDGVWRSGFGELVRQVVANQPKQIKQLCELAPAYAERQPDALKEVVQLAVKLRLKYGEPTLGRELSLILEPESQWRMPHGYALVNAIVVELGDLVAAGEFDRELAMKVIEALRHCGALEGFDYTRVILSRLGRELHPLF